MEDLRRDRSNRPEVDRSGAGLSSLYATNNQSLINSSGIPIATSTPLRSVGGGPAGHYNAGLGLSPIVYGVGAGSAVGPEPGSSMGPPAVPVLPSPALYRHHHHQQQHSASVHSRDPLLDALDSKIRGEGLTPAEYSAYTAMLQSGLGGAAATASPVTGPPTGGLAPGTGAYLRGGPLGYSRGPMSASLLDTRTNAVAASAGSNGRKRRRGASPESANLSTTTDELLYRSQVVR